MKKIAILGASFLQKPLVLKAKEMGLETHVFAWREGNVVEDICDFYYDISTLDKEAVLNECVRIGIDGIISIASDIAMPTVNFIANKLGLIGNSLESAVISTDKLEMRRAYHKAGIQCPQFELYNEANFQNKSTLSFPVIVKPTDSSGSRGVTKVYQLKHVNKAIETALENSISGRVIIEEFLSGREFSVEGISVNGKHEVITITDKVTTGEPNYVELEHHQPAQISLAEWKAIEVETIKALDALKISNGASHTEVFLLDDGQVQVMELAGRMGGDWIGSHMVQASTGFDYLKAVLKISLRDFDLDCCRGEREGNFSGVYFITPKQGQVNEVKFKPDLAVKDYHLVYERGRTIDPELDSSAKRAALFFYVASEYAPYNRESQQVINYK